MKRMFAFLLFSSWTMLLGQNTPRPPDAPLPDAVPFCHTPTDTEKNEYANCTCATANDGELCKSDEPLPYFCKRMCGHSKKCACCGLKK